ncbi:MAG: hypothetical protein WBR33_21945 [Pseudonocardiaceae bacterium]
MATTEIVQAAQTVIEYVAGIAALPATTWCALRTRTGRTITTVIRAEIRDLWLRAKEVPVEKRQELAVNAMRQDLDSK